MAVTAPADRRFRRSQIHATRRRRLRARPIYRALRAAGVLGLALAGAIWAAGAVARVPWFDVRHIEVSGNQRLHQTEVAGLLDGLIGERLLAVDLERWRARLLASPWIADARLRRRLPATIHVEVRERVPLGLARAAEDLYLVDASGAVIDDYGPRYAELDLPIIDGLVARPASRPPAIDPRRWRLAFRLLAELRTRPGLATRVSQVDVSNLHDARVILDGDPAIVRLGDTQFLERLESYVGLQATLREQVPDIDYVDVRFGERVYVGLSSAPAAAPVRERAAAAAGRPRARAQR